MSSPCLVEMNLVSVESVGTSTRSTVIELAVVRYYRGFAVRGDERARAFIWYVDVREGWESVGVDDFHFINGRGGGLCVVV